MKHSVPDEEYMDDEYEDDEEYSDEEYQDEDEGRSGRGRLIGVLVGIVSLCLVLLVGAMVITVVQLFVTGTIGRKEEK